MAAGAWTAVETLADAAFSSPGGVAPGGSASGTVLFRFGTKAESAEQLAAQAAKAEAAGLPHGVSTTTRAPTKTAASSAARAAVEEHFPVQQTGGDPAHHTVGLPKPVTQQVADVFNKLFGRSP